MGVASSGVMRCWRGEGEEVLRSITGRNQQRSVLHAASDGYNRLCWTPFATYRFSNESGDRVQGCRKNVLLPFVPRQMLKMSKRGVCRKEALIAMLGCSHPIKESGISKSKNVSLGVWRHWFLGDIAQVPFIWLIRYCFLNACLISYRY